MAASLQHDENYFFYTWIPLFTINFGQDIKNNTYAPAGYWSPVYSSMTNSIGNYDTSGRMAMSRVGDYHFINDTSCISGWTTGNQDDAITFMKKNKLTTDGTTTGSPDMGLVKRWMIIQYLCGITNPFSVFNQNYCRGYFSVSGAIPANGNIYDAEEFVMPRDISTNLFYYKGVPTSSLLEQATYSANIHNQDEVIIINARKMYSEPDENDERPIGSNICLNFEDLKDTEVILTSKIIGNEEELSKYFNEVHVFVNDKLEYSRELKNTNENWRECRYTDAHSEGLQWKLFELKNNIKFSTTDGFELPLNQIIGNTIKYDPFKVPCKMTISLSGLVFQQQCRYGVEFDNINNILFDQRVFDGSVFGIGSANAGITNVIKERFGLLRVGSVDPAGTAVPSAIVGGNVSNSTNYYLIKRSTSDLEDPKNAFGGINYYNDFYEMKINTNSANKWKTYPQKTQFSKLLVYPDYNPAPGGRIVGIPYLNQEDTIVLVENVVNGTSTGGQGTIDQIESVASLVKIATDDAYVNPVSQFDTDEVSLYPSTLIIPISCSNVSIGQYYDEGAEQSESLFGESIEGVYNFTFNISGSVGSFKTYSESVGIKYFNIDNSLFNGLSSDTSSSVSNQFGIYFDGLEGVKEIYIKNNNVPIYFSGIIGSSTPYYILGLNKSFITLINQNGTGVFTGFISIQMTQTNPQSSNTIQIHNFKLPAPILTSVSVSFNNEQEENLTYDGYYSLNDEVWQGQVYLNGSTSNLVNSTNYNNLRLYSSSQPNSDLSGNSTILTDDDGNISGLLLTIKIPGFKLFKSAGMKYFLESEQYVTLSSTEMVNAYNKSFGITDNNGNYYLQEYYNPNAKIGSQVVSGTITNAYNYVETAPMSIKSNVGVIKFRYNPPDDDKFQLEVITKSKNGKFNKSLYYVNKAVDRWYNMSFYKKVLQNKDGSELKSTIHFLLNNVDASTSGQISSEPAEIFRCFVKDDATVDGTSIKFDLGKSVKDNAYTSSISNGNNWSRILFPRATDGNITSCMKNWKSLYDIKFDKCQRTVWNCKFTNDPKYLAYSYDETESEYKTRGNYDLFKVSDSLNNLNFSNLYGQIKLFANAELESCLSTNVDWSRTHAYPNNYNFNQYSNRSDIIPPFYNLYVGNNFLDYSANSSNSYGVYADIEENDLEGTNVSANKTGPGVNSVFLNNAYILRKILTNYYPRRILYQDSVENYVLKRRPPELLSPTIKGVCLQVNNVMYVSTPNLYYKNNSGVAYVDSYFESQGAVKDYEEFFGNPQHRLPPVSYKHRLLDSDYATFIYGNYQKLEAINNYISNDSLIESITYDYNNVPSKISFVWGNSQVTRSESIIDNNGYISKLYWNKSAFNEYTSEVGSVYNYQDAQSVTNIVTVDVGAITDRQCVLMPVINSPMEYEARSAEEGVVKITDNIIATSALGYNSTGYPKNGVLSYNTNGNVTINSKLRNYIFIEQAAARK